MTGRMIGARVKMRCEGERRGGEEETLLTLLTSLISFPSPFSSHFSNPVHVILPTTACALSSTPTRCLIASSCSGECTILITPHGIGLCADARAVSLSQFAPRSHHCHSTASQLYTNVMSSRSGHYTNSISSHGVGSAPTLELISSVNPLRESLC